jgi:hypothetical protein
MVEAEPPTRLPRVPVVVKGPETAREEVAAEAKVFAPVA